MIFSFCSTYNRGVPASLEQLSVSRGEWFTTVNLGQAAQKQLMTVSIAIPFETFIPAETPYQLEPSQTSLHFENKWKTRMS
jgi:hypothetical protein